MENSSKTNDKEKSKIIIFDLDGTLYKLKGGSFANSKLYKKIQQNAVEYIQKNLNISKIKSKKILKRTRSEYGENISIALESIYNLNRYDYFKEVWKINPKKYIEKYADLEDVLIKLSKEYKFMLMSDAPKVWIDNVLKELNIKDFFEDNVLSGEGEKRKVYGNRFNDILNNHDLNAEDVLVVGDQEETDIIPAHKLGFKTIYINKKNSSQYADINLKNIDNLEPAITFLFSNINGNKYYKFALETLRIPEGFNTTIFQGSSASVVFKYKDKLYKSGPTSEINKELNIYRNFEKTLGKHFKKIFPEFKTIKEQKGFCLCAFDFVGSYNLEDYILSPKIKNKKFIYKINKTVLKNLDKIFKLSYINDPAQKTKVFQELLEAININLDKAEMLDEKQKYFLNKVEENKNIFTEHLKISLSHKDLTAGNIIINKAKKRSYFVDPRATLPNLQKKDFSWGNIGFDLAGYYVTTVRKEMELQKDSPQNNLNEIKKEIEIKKEKWIKNHIINEKFFDLCVLFWYSVYLSCKCDYCMSPKREWLYIEMAEKYNLYKNKIEKFFDK
jgi:HAD superfamily hydrolase (TIGR01549 family)